MTLLQEGTLASPAVIGADVMLFAAVAVDSDSIYIILLPRVLISVTLLAAPKLCLAIQI